MAELSPSVWRVWIEISGLSFPCIASWASPSVWRVWIEITRIRAVGKPGKVTLRVEGVD